MSPGHVTPGHLPLPFFLKLQSTGKATGFMTCMTWDSWLPRDWDQLQIQSIYWQNHVMRPPGMCSPAVIHNHKPTHLTSCRGSTSSYTSGWKRYTDVSVNDLSKDVTWQQNWWKLNMQSLLWSQCMNHYTTKPNERAHNILTIIMSTCLIMYQRQ